MSDFSGNFWSVYILALTLLSILGCLILLWLTARKKVDATQDNTTGHVWDEDLSESNNPLPLWWVGLFVVSILFGLVYLLSYPGLGAYQGLLGWSSKAEHAQEMVQAEQALVPLYARFTDMSTEKIAGDPQARAIGERLFMNHCSQCHGSDARGSKGFPNLTDKDWLHGGTPEIIAHSIGAGRNGQMPPMSAAVGSPSDIKNVANYVLKLSGSPHDTVRAGLGKSKFAVCAACHGADGKGNQTLGAPNLTDNVWLHGWGQEGIVAIIEKGKTNQMPAHSDKLSPAQIQVLSAYIWGLSNKPSAIQ